MKQIQVVAAIIKKDKKTSPQTKVKLLLNGNDY